MVKPFNKQTYNKYDKKAKEGLLNIISNSYINPDKYGPDIIQKKYNKIIYHEVEIKIGWEDEWPVYWQTVDIPARKMKFVEKYNNLVLWVINNKITKAWGIDAEYIQKENEILIKDKMVTADSNYFKDKFIKVPLKFCVFKLLKK